jgi:hypothetical protein
MESGVEDDVLPSLSEDGDPLDEDPLDG